MARSQRKKSTSKQLDAAAEARRSREAIEKSNELRERELQHQQVSGIGEWYLRSAEQVIRLRGGNPDALAQPRGEWSTPMPKTKIMIRLKLKPGSFATFAKSHELKRLSRQLWQIRLDRMDASTRRKIETGK